MAFRNVILRVAVDLDDTISHFLKTLNKFYHEKYGKLFHLSDYKQNIPYHQTWGITKEESVKILNEFYSDESFLNLPPMECAKRCLQSLKQTGRFEFYVVTARGDDLREKTLSWLQKHFTSENGIFLFSGVEFGNSWGIMKGIVKEKHVMCKELNCEILIDDNFHHVFSCAQNGIYSILFNFCGTYPWCDYHWNNRDGKELIDSSKIVQANRDWFHLELHLLDRLQKKFIADTTPSTVSMSQMLETTSTQNDIERDKKGLEDILRNLPLNDPDRHVWISAYQSLNLKENN